MCGICGIFNTNGEPVSSEILGAMNDMIAHRGPDGAGLHVDGAIGFGHRRLAIIDLSDSGAQPMKSTEGRYTITYNGEIYNYRELRSELESLGHIFRSTSDTEVILNAYAQWRESCLDKFNGMFAFAIWDSRDQSLFLARDRYGIKPLYYASLGNTFLFASEQKAILKHPLFYRELDLEGLFEYFTFQNFFTNKTLFRKLNLFPAGHWGTLKRGETRPRIHEYWDYNFKEPERPLSEDEYAEELHALFQQAVKRQLVSDVEIGAYLSGGTDSGSITAIAASELPYIKSFTCGFDLHSASGLELAFDERENAEHMSYLFKTAHYEMVLKAGDMERCMPSLAWHLEEPRVGQSYPNYYAAHLASKFVKVVLGGAGGDELFGGYPWRYYRAVRCNDFEDYIDRYYDFWQRLIPTEKIRQVFAPVWNEVKHVSTRDIFKGVFGKRSNQPCSPQEYVNNSLYFEAKTFLHGLLVVKDKLTMAHGLEARVPFLDNDLVDFAMRVPVNLKLGNLHQIVGMDENEAGKDNKYFNKTRDGKLLLRKVMRRYVPQSIAFGAKQGFSAPDASWFRGESIEYVAKSLIKRNARVFDYMDKATTQAMIMEHLEGKANRRLLVWSLLNVENWFDHFFSNTQAQGIV